MPSFGRIKKVSALGVAVAALGITASGASAATNDVWLWACHGPAGSEAGSAFGETDFAAYGDGCETQAADLDAGGLRGTLAAVGTAPSQGIVYGDTASANLIVPSGTQLTSVRLQRRTTGVVAGVDYSATALGTPLESTSGTNVPADDKTFAVNPGTAKGGSVVLKLNCTTATSCPATGPAALDVGRVGLKLSDTAAPYAAVGNYRSPAAGTLELDFAAGDVGTGLRYAQAWITGGAVTTVQFQGTDCRDMTADATVDMPLGAKCVFNDHATVSVNTDTPAFPDGDGYTLNYRVVDWAGNEYNETKPLSIANHVNLGVSSQTLNIGTSGTTTPNANGTTNGGTGNVAGASAQNCRSPRLSLALAQKPMRTSKGVPVLQYGKRYRFNGRLTCVINGKRMSAPKRARVDITNKIGKKTYFKAGTTVRDKGRLTVILAYKSSRTITFRFTNTDGQRSTVNIKVKVEKKKSTRR